MMKFAVPLVLFFIFFVWKPHASIGVTSSRRGLLSIKRCSSRAIQRDILCGCYVGNRFNLLPPETVHECMILFRAGVMRMAKACTIYTINDSIRFEDLINNLTFIRDKCQVIMSDVVIPVNNRMLTDEEIEAILDRIRDMILEVLNGLNKGRATVAPGFRMIISGGNERRVKAVRLASYNDIELHI